MREEIVVPAWKLASESATIKKFNFVPSLLATAYLSFIVLYQVAWSYVYIFKLKDRFFSYVIEFAHSSYFIETLVVIGVFFILYLLVTPIAEGGLIYLISHKDSGEDWNRPYGKAVSAGLRNFLPIFEANNLLSPFKLLSIVTFYLFLLRIFGRDYAVSISVLAIIYLVFSFLINILFAYTRFFIIFKGDRAFEAMGKSVRMALDNLEVTFQLYFTLLLVYVRTILTVVAFIIFPLVVSTILTYVTVAFIKTAAILVVAGALLFFLGFVSHLNSVLEIFVESLWFRAWKDNSVRMSAETERNSKLTAPHDDHHENHGHDHGHHAA